MVDNDIKELSILEKDNYEKNINLNKIYNKNYLGKRMKETYSSNETMRNLVSMESSFDVKSIGGTQKTNLVVENKPELLRKNDVVNLYPKRIFSSSSINIKI